MRMRMLIVFALSALALGGATYWRAYYPQAWVSTFFAEIQPDGKPGQMQETLEEFPSPMQNIAVGALAILTVVSGVAVARSAWGERRGMKASSKEPRV